MKSYGESIPTPVSAIFAEAGIISELAYRATVASDSSLSGIGSNKIRGQGSVPRYNRLRNDTAMVTPARGEVGRAFLIPTVVEPRVTGVRAGLVGRSALVSQEYRVLWESPPSAPLVATATSP